MQASPIQQFSTEVSGATDISYAAGATIVVIADSSGHGADDPSGDDHGGNSGADSRTAAASGTIAMSHAERLSRDWEA